VITKYTNNYKKNLTVLQKLIRTLSGTCHKFTLDFIRPAQFRNFLVLLRGAGGGFVFFPLHSIGGATAYQLACTVHIIHSFIFVYWEQKWQNASAQVIAIQDEYKNSKNS